MLYPVAPHLSEEIYSKMGNKKILAKTEWPEVKLKFDKKEYEKGIQIEKLVSDIMNIKKLVNKKISNVYLYVIPPEYKLYSSILKVLESRLKLQIKLQISSSKDLYDPENKSNEPNSVNLQSM